MDAPFVPSSRTVVRAMIDFAELKGTETVFDLGAGDARILIAAKKKHPSIRAVGVEILPFVWALGRLNILLSRCAIEWRRGNALTQDMREADCVLLYLFPKVMKTLQEKFDRELKPGTTVISYVFRFPDRKPEKEMVVPWLGGKNVLRLYRW